jgi:hypothetical protein
MNEHEWETVHETDYNRLVRFRVEGGWLYHLISGHIMRQERLATMCFVTDSPERKWTHEEYQRYLAEHHLQEARRMNLPSCKHGLVDRCALCDAIPCKKKREIPDKPSPL